MQHLTVRIFQYVAEIGNNIWGQVPPAPPLPMSAFVICCTFPKWIMWDQERLGNPTCLVMFFPLFYEALTLKGEI